MSEYVQISEALTPRAIAASEPYARQAADNEMDSEHVQTELANFANLLAAEIQRSARGRKSG